MKNGHVVGYGCMKDQYAPFYERLATMLTLGEIELAPHPMTKQFGTITIVTGGEILEHLADFRRMSDVKQTFARAFDIDVPSLPPTARGYWTEWSFGKTIVLRGDGKTYSFGVREGDIETIRDGTSETIRAVFDEVGNRLLYRRPIGGGRDEQLENMLSATAPAQPVRRI